ncbi:MAG: SOS response-associated peptidase family protein [Balneolaceae bacterium]
MIKRVAFFAHKNEIESYFGISSRQENLFEPHYNLSPGQHIPVVNSDGDGLNINRIRWGEETNSKISSTEIPLEKTEEELRKKNTHRCVVPLSGFYVWKENREKDHPFFVRMLNNPIMSVAGIYYSKEPYFKIILTESNALIHPMSKEMPLLLDQALGRHWLNSEEATSDLLEKAGNLFLLTDISVMRVHKKVNDPTLNDSSLVQPIPK